MEIKGITFPNDKKIKTLKGKTEMPKNNKSYGLLRSILFTVSQAVAASTGYPPTTMLSHAWQDTEEQEAALGSFSNYSWEISQAPSSPVGS